MKSEKAITLTALVIYMVLFSLVIVLVTNISRSFVTEVIGMKSFPRDVIEYNKFAMFFVSDVKCNSEIKSLSDTKIEFGDGTVYEYADNKMYRNGQKISKNTNVKFEQNTTTVDNTQKNIIKVIIMNNSGENIDEIEYVLKYW